MEAEARFIRSLVDDEAEGAVLWYIGGERNLPALQAARARGVEFVFVGRRPPRGFETDFVGTENVGSARNAVGHLIATGHRRIAFVGNLDAAAAARRAAQALLDLRATAAFVVNDTVALLLIEALRELGASVPDDVSVVGFDGLLAWLPGGGPLTTARQNFSTLGELAGEALFARLAPDSPSTYRHVLLDAPLSLGGSTALLRTGPDLLPSSG